MNVIRSKICSYVLQVINAIGPVKNKKVQMANIQLNLFVKSVKRKENINYMPMSAHNVNMLYMKNALKLNLNVMNVRRK